MSEMGIYVNNALGFLNRVAAELDVPNEGWSSVGI
jgi:hypothetical protein